MLDIERRGATAVIRLDHGPVNALDLELLQALTEAIRELDDDVPLVLTGAGRAFSAGVDLRRIIEGGAPYVADFLPALSETFLAVYDHPGPVVAAVNGHAIAGGCVIAAACDVRVMSGGTIGLAELAVGVPFPTSALEIMRAAVGPLARRLALTAELLDPAGARAIGLIDQVCAAESLLDDAVQQAAELGAVPAPVYAFTKRQLQQPTRKRIAARQEAEDAQVRELWATDAVQSRIATYLQSLRRT